MSEGEPLPWRVMVSHYNGTGRSGTPRAGRYVAQGEYDSLDEAASVVAELRKSVRIAWAYVEEHGE